MELGCGRQSRGGTLLVGALAVAARVWLHAKVWAVTTEAACFIRTAGRLAWDDQLTPSLARQEPLHPALFVLLDSSPDDPPTPSLSNGKRAHSPSPGPSTLPNGKRPHLDSPSCLPIASLTFSLVLDPDSTTTKVAELLNLLSTSTSSYPVEIVYGRKAREASLTLVSPTTSTPTSQTPLLSLDPVNRTLWNPPSTAPVGAGSLLEAIAALASLSLLSLSPSLSASYPDLSLRIQITLEPAFFTHATTPSHALFLNYLFPSPLPEGWEGETTISDFYRCLRRAPRTVGGIAVGVDRKGKGREDRKGKGRAVEEDTREDELLEPEGLEATLMPFQSRSVRWMLAREGKRVRPMLEEEEEDVEMGEGGEDDLEGVREREKEPVVLERLEEEEMRDLWRGPLWEKVEREDLQGVERGFWLNRVAGRLSLVDPLEERLEVSLFQVVRVRKLMSPRRMARREDETWRREEDCSARRWDSANHSWSSASFSSVRPPLSSFAPR